MVLKKKLASFFICFFTLVMHFHHTDNSPARGESFEAVTKALQFLFVICRGVHTDKDGYIAFLRNEMPHQLAGECSIYKRIDGDGGKALRPRRVRSNTHNRNSTPSRLVDARPKPTWVSRRDH